MLDFRLLGPLEVLRNGEQLPLGGQRQRAVLALLVLEANRPVSTDRIADAVWGDTPPPTASASLRNTLSELRKLLGADALETHPAGYVLRAAPEQVDATRLEHAVARAREAPPHERGPQLRDALRDWRGSPLPEVAYAAFAQSEIRRLEELRLAALEEALDAELTSGRAGELVPELEALVAAEPHRERLRGQLMIALYRAGRQADALASYQAARRVLAEQLGIDPSPSLRQLHGSILRQEARLDARTDDEPAADHFSEVADVLLAGRLVPVLGTTVDGLAEALAGRFRYPPGDVSSSHAFRSTRPPSWATDRCTTSCTRSCGTQAGRRPCTGSSPLCRHSSARAAPRTS
jgi:DNA-binding SARP family transcriptional activator